MAADRYLIINADDFGLSHGVNRGIIEAHRHGVVTSASLMVRWPAAREAADYSREHPSLSVGLHFDLGEWAYRDGEWVALYEIVSTGDITAVAGELSHQIVTFLSLFGRPPTHLDSHQHVHRSEPTRSVMLETARKLRVPLRDFSPEIRYCGDFYGQTGKGEPFPDGISVDRLIRVLTGLPPGITELGCHPGEVDDMDAMYLSERAQEVKVLCDPRVRAAITAEGIELCSFRDIAGIPGRASLPTLNRCH